MIPRLDLRLTASDLRLLRVDPHLQGVLLQIAMETRAMLLDRLERNRVAPEDLSLVHNLICDEDERIDNIVKFLGGKVTVTLFDHTELPESCAHLRRTLTVTADGSRATHCAPSRSQ